MVKVLDNPSTPSPETTRNGHAPSADARPDLPSSEIPESAEAALKVVRTLVEAGKVRLARERAAAFLEIWPDNERLQAADRVLGPPKVWSHAPDRPYIPRTREFQWLREHAKEYSGQWVALLGDQVLASGVDFKAVQAELKKTEGGSNALLHFQPAAPWIR